MRSVADLIYGLLLLSLPIAFLSLHTMSEAKNILVPLLGAVQASVAVLLTIAFGVVAAQFNLLTQASAKDISKACVRLFLPALLIVNVGSQMSLDTVSSTLNDK